MKKRKKKTHECYYMETTFGNYYCKYCGKELK